MITEFAVFIIAGGVAGLLAGLLGSGGGIIVVPTLAFMFRLHHMPHHLIMHMAIGTSLAIMIITCLTSSYAHYKNDNLLTHVYIKIAPGIALGTIFAVIIAHFLPGHFLHHLFALFVLLSAIQVAFKFTPKHKHPLPHTWALASAGTAIGTIAAMLGIGGSVLTVPYFLWCNISMNNVVALAAACTIPVAIIGAVGFAIIGMAQHSLPTWSTGYIYWPAFFGIALGSFALAPWGAKLGKHMPELPLRIMFVSLLILVGILMLLHPPRI